jgi:glyoxylase-like metal-dependent hydrolase (beta-lactamase superfamily II)
MRQLASGAGFARYALGDVTVIALHDGYVDLPAGRLRKADGQPCGADLPEEVCLVDGRLRLSVNAFLVVDQGRHILIDTGASDAWEPTMGGLLASLDAAGVAREAITTVALTHTHEDHVHGLVAPGGADAFPRLERLLVPDAELARFDACERLARFRARREPFADGADIGPGVRAVAARGHEVGHSAFEVQSAGETLLVWGDIVHVPAVQFARPDLSWELDADQVEARATRLVMLRRASRPGCHVAGAHLEFPGIGVVRDAGGRFVYTPLGEGAA